MLHEGKRGLSGRLAGVVVLLFVASMILLLGVGSEFFVASPAARSAGVMTAQADSGTIATGAGIFTEATIAITVAILLIGAFSLQIARNYFLRTLDKFTLRLGADIWWLAYIMIRDGLMFGVLLLGFEMFFVGTYADYAIAVPFMPLAIVLVAATLVVKLVWDTDEEEKKNRLVTTLLASSAFLYIFGVLTVTESIVGYATAGYLQNADGTIATPAGGSDFWTVIYNAFSSTVNATLATVSFYACFTALGLLAAFAFFWVIRPSRKGGAKRVFLKASALRPSTRNRAVQPASEKTD